MATSISRESIEINLRGFRTGDIDAWVEAQNTANAFDKTQRGTSPAELAELFQSSGFVPERDVTLAEVSGQLVGAQWILYRDKPDGHSFFVNGFVHPDWRRRGIGKQLLTCALEDITVRRQALSGSAYVASFAYQHEDGRQALLEQFGLEPVRYISHYVRDRLDDLPEVQAPQGIDIRSYTPADKELARLALNEAFQDHWSHWPIPVDDWEQWTGSPDRRFDLWRIAWAGDEVAGVCLCELEEARNARMGTHSGLVDDLAVRRPWRKCGLGTALILSGMRALRQAGLRGAHLFADSENLTGATRIYERLGFVEDWRSIAFRRNI